MQEADEIKRIIGVYEAASGQRINLDKTEVTVSSNIPPDKHKELSQRVGVRDVEKHEKYLGLPTLIGRANRNIFNGVMEKIGNKLKDWKEKFLSQAGKEVLIKTVIQAIPTYAMSCFLIPTTTCQDMEKEAARFFWGSTPEEQKCHWASWDKLKASKAKGGMGFRELHYFNLAMLAKQLWGLMQNPNSISSRILRAKYTSQCDILKAGPGSNPSYLWRSILASRELVKDGLAWMVGNGRSIFIMDDRWVGVENLETPRSVLPEEWQGKTVSELIEAATGQWNKVLIEELFEPREAARILAMPRPLTQCEDQMVWRFTKQGWFSVKSAYHRAVARFSPSAERRPSASTVQKGWAEIWKIQTIPKVRMLLWRACANALPVKENLCRHKCSDDPVCVLCGEHTESITHLLMYCTQVKPIWYASSLRLDMEQQRFASFDDFLWSSMENYPTRYTSLVAYITWEIWYHRNAVIFEKKKWCFQKVLQRATTRWREDDHSREEKENKPQPQQSSKWEKPPAGKYKLNVDVAVFPNEKIGLGYVLLDEQGKIRLAGKIECTAVENTTVLEGLALRYALQEVKRYRLRPHIIESDNQNIVSKINGKGAPDVHTSHIVHDIKNLMVSMECTECRYIPRQANQVAHYIAHDPDFISINHDPEHVLSFIEMDVIAS